MFMWRKKVDGRWRNTPLQTKPHFKREKMQWVDKLISTLTTSLLLLLIGNHFSFKLRNIWNLEVLRLSLVIPKPG